MAPSTARPPRSLLCSGGILPRRRDVWHIVGSRQRCDVFTPQTLPCSGRGVPRETNHALTGAEGSSYLLPSFWPSLLPWPGLKMNQNSQKSLPPFSNLSLFTIPGPSLQAAPLTHAVGFGVGRIGNGVFSGVMGVAQKDPPPFCPSPTPLCPFPLPSKCLEFPHVPIPQDPQQFLEGRV